jgi:hypothetical protein
VENFFRGAFI